MQYLLSILFTNLQRNNYTLSINAWSFSLALKSKNKAKWDYKHLSEHLKHLYPVYVKIELLTLICKFIQVFFFVLQSNLTVALMLQWNFYPLYHWVPTIKGFFSLCSLLRSLHPCYSACFASFSGQRVDNFLIYPCRTEYI